MQKLTRTTDEAFDFDDRNFCLVGRQTHHRFSLGDPIRIKVAHADLFRKQLDYDLVSHESSLYTAEPVFFEPFIRENKRGAKHTGKAPKRERKNGGRQKMRKRR